MKFVWHILRKDSRRLWWEILVTLALLAALAREDGWRWDAVPGVMEGVLNLILPLGWSYLVALLVLEENLSEPRAWWRTRPYPRFWLAVAKVLFVLVWIHVPAVLADAWVLASRGFSPWEHAGYLLGKQAMMFAMLTLPAMALASVCRKLAYFFVASLGLLLCLGIMWSGAPGRAHPWSAMDLLRYAFTAVLLSASVAILALQYARQPLWRARVLGVVCVVCLMAAALAGWGVTAALRAECVLQGDGGSSPVTVQLGSDDMHRLSMPVRLDRVSFALPVSVDSTLAGTMMQALFAAGRLEAAGNSWRVGTAGIRADRDAEVLFTVMPPARSWLQMRPQVWRKIEGRPVRLQGEMLAYFGAQREAGSIRVGEGVRTLPDGRRCQAEIVEDQFRRMVKVECERPGRLTSTRVRLIAQAGKSWEEFLGSSAPYLSHPSATFLSPVERRTTFFHITERDTGVNMGGQWMVPQAQVQGARIEFRDYVTAGCRVAEFDFRNLDLKAYLAR